MPCAQEAMDAMGSSDAAGAVARGAAQALAAAGGQMAVLPDAAQQDKAAWCAPFVLCKSNREPVCRGSGSAVLIAPQMLVLWLWRPRYSRQRGRHAAVLFKVSQQDKTAWCCAHFPADGQNHEMLNKHTVSAFLMSWWGCESRAHQDAQPIHLQTQLSSHAVACASGCSTAQFPLLAHTAAMGAVRDK